MGFKSSLNSFLLLLLTIKSSNSIRISPGKDQRVGLYEGPTVRNLAKSQTILPSFILTSKPFVSEHSKDYFTGSKKPEWEPSETYLIDCAPGRRCEQTISFDEEEENEVDSSLQAPPRYDFYDKSPSKQSSAMIAELEDRLAHRDGYKQEQKPKTKFSPRPYYDYKPVETSTYYDNYANEIDRVSSFQVSSPPVKQYEEEPDRFDKYSQNNVYEDKYSDKYDLYDRHKDTNVYDSHKDTQNDYFDRYQDNYVDRNDNFYDRHKEVDKYESNRYKPKPVHRFPSHYEVTRRPSPPPKRLPTYQQQIRNPYDPFAFHAKNGKKKRPKIRGKEFSRAPDYPEYEYHRQPRPSHVLDSRLQVPQMEPSASTRSYFGASSSSHRRRPSTARPKPPKQKNRWYFPTLDDFHRERSRQKVYEDPRRTDHLLPARSRPETPKPKYYVIKPNTYGERYGWESAVRNNEVEDRRGVTPAWVSLDSAKPEWISED